MRAQLRLSPQASKSPVSKASQVSTRLRPNASQSCTRSLKMSRIIIRSSFNNSRPLLSKYVNSPLHSLTSTSPLSSLKNLSSKPYSHHKLTIPVSLNSSRTPSCIQLLQKRSFANGRGGGSGGGVPPGFPGWNIFQQAQQQQQQPEAHLKRYTRDLTALARQGKIDPVIGRDDEIRRVIQVLSRRTKNNLVLLGEAGVGKTAIAEGLALRIVNNDVPDTMLKKKILSLDLASLIAGTGIRGEFEERMRGLLHDIAQHSDDIILFIDELHTVVGAGSADGGNMDASNLLKPALARGDLHCVGATTLAEYRKYIEKDPAFSRRFQSVMVPEPTVQDTISILRGLKERYEVHHGVHITDSALVAAAVYSNRYITTRFLPDKAIDLIDEAASRLRLQQESKPEPLEILDRSILTLKIEKAALQKEPDAASKARLQQLEKELVQKEAESEIMTKVWERERAELRKIKNIKERIDNLQTEAAQAQRAGDLSTAARILYGEIPELRGQLPPEGSTKGFTTMGEAVTEPDIALVVSRSTGIPIQSLLITEKQKLLEMEKHLSSRVVGQDAAVGAVCNTVRIARAGLHPHNRPLGSFLFLGPTGVGKTELCKALAEFLFNSENSIIRIDMSEYMEKHEISKLIGAPPGYVGYGEAGILSEAVRRKPYSVVLFDEFEKAHPAVSNLLLQVLDEGHLTDGEGRKVDFKNTTIILTSNLGAHHLANLPEGAPSSDASELILSEAKRVWAPEFLNRIDEQIIFNRLGFSQMKSIVKLQIQELNDLVAGKKLKISVSKKARQWLAEEGYSPSYGARPLKRVIQRKLLNPMSKMILEGKINEADEVSVDYESGDEVLIRSLGRRKDLPSDEELRHDYQAKINPSPKTTSHMTPSDSGPAAVARA